MQWQGLTLSSDSARALDIEGTACAWVFHFLFSVICSSDSSWLGQ